MRLLFLLLLAAPAALAQPAPDRPSLREAEREAGAARDEARAAGRSVRAAEAAERGLAERRAAAGRRAVAAETALAEAEARLAAAEAQRDAAEADLTRRAEALAPMIPAMRRLGLWPAETLLAVPAPPEDALRGVLILRHLARRLAAEAAEYRQAREDATRAAAALEEERNRLLAARLSAREAAEAVEEALAEARTRRETARDTEAEAARRAAGAAGRARDLRAAVERLEREAEAREARERAETAARIREAEAREAAAQAREREAESREREARAADARDRAARDRQEALREAEAARDRAEAARERASQAALPAGPPPARGAPVAGRIQRDFGQDGATGQSWAAAPGARVVSPCGGRVVFSGPFRSFGRMLILDCGGGYHFVLSGLDRLDAEVGQRLAAGEAVGTLGNASGGGVGRATLYVELRRNGQAVDPRGWTARG
ncbi:murein hydrolase activator EnvC family protein [Muricoccus radiodurans]|uniref:murein hydrolase activator EnvC family protein n=1 Tax=Muricoccus radiodurans TaxID=2231721 RepID=UPI003CEAB2DC